MDLNLNSGKFTKTDNNHGEASYFFCFSRHVSVNAPLTKKQMAEMVSDFQERFTVYVNKVIDKNYAHNEHFYVSAFSCEFQLKVDKRKYDWLNFLWRRYDGCQIYVNALVTVKTRHNLNYMKMKYACMLNSMTEEKEYIPNLIFGRNHLRDVFTDFKTDDFFIQNFCYIR